MGALATHGTEAEGFTVAEVPFVFTYKKMVDICDEQIVTRFGVFFDKWIIEFLKEIHGGSPGVALKTINKEFNDHLATLRSYIDKLESAKVHVPKYATLSLEIEVEDLLTKIAARIGNQYVPKYVTKLKVGEDIEAEIPNIGDLIETVKQTELNPPNIAKVAALFRNADSLTAEDPAKSDYVDVVAELGDGIVEQLIEILKVALNHPDDSKFKGLSENDIALLQSFVNEFKFLFDLPKMREIILNHILGDSASPAYSQAFFTPEFFKSLNDVPNNQYKDYFIFDEFIMSELTDPDLKRINTAAKRFFYDRLFPALFDTSFADLDLDASTAEKDHSHEARLKRHKAKVERMAYIVFAFVRDTGALPYQKPATNEQMIEEKPVLAPEETLKETLKKLFDWVSETPIFDPDTQPLTASEGDQSLVVKPIPAQHALIAPHDFRKNYLPLLNWICQKIDKTDCKLFKEKKAKVVGQFKKFGNTLDFDREEELKDSIPKELLEEIKAEAVKSHVEDLGKSLEKVRTMRNRKQKNAPTFAMPNLEEREAPTNRDQELGQPTEIIEMELPPITGTLTPEETEELDKETYNIFKEEIIEKVIAPDVNEPGKLKIDQINLILDAADSANDETKDFIKKGFVKYITTELIRGHATLDNQTDLVKRVTGHFIDELRSRIDFVGGLGLRNFLVYNLRTIQRPAGSIQKLPVRDQFLFVSKLYDLIFFLDFATEGYIEMLKQDPLKDPQDGSIRSLKVITDKQREYKANLDSYPQKTKLTIGRFVEATKKELSTSPFLMAHIHSFNLMTAFVDFFEYFDVLQISNAQYLDYQSVFVNFYDFLINVRYRTTEHQRKPYDYVLAELYGCLEFTEHPEELDGDDHRKEVCNLSHRKYAEMLYFFKLYLIKTNKRGEFDLAPYPGTEFDTHARMFLSFVTQNDVFQVAFLDRCKTQDAPICQASEIHRHVLDQMTKKEVIRLNLDDKKFANFDLDTPSNKIIMINGLEAVLIASGVHGNIKDYEKNMGTFQVFKDESAFTFTEEDVPALANYFKRTFKKAIFDKKERRIAQLVQGILGGPEDPERPSKDTLKSYLVFAGVVIPDFLKVFLLYAQTDAEYERIARVVVEQEMGAAVAKLNSLEHNNLIIEITAAVEAMGDDKEALRIIRDKLHGLYASLNNVCSASIKHTVLATTNEPTEWGYMNQMLEEENAIDEELVQEENKDFEDDVLNKIQIGKTVQVVSKAFTVPIDHLKKEEAYEKQVLNADAKVLDGLGVAGKFQGPIKDFGDSEQSIQPDQLGSLSNTGSFTKLVNGKASRLLGKLPGNKTPLKVGSGSPTIGRRSPVAQVVQDIVSKTELTKEMIRLV